MDVVTYALAQKYVKNAIGSLDAVTDVTVDGNSVVNADGVAEIVTPQILGEVADVKVDGQSVVDSEGVAQITLPDSANAISYDNSESGLDSTNVQDAVDEVLDKANKVDDVQTYGGNTLVTNKIADLSALTIKKDIPSTPTAIATFSDGAEMVMPSLTVGIEAVQDLHGYDSPWVGGAGKNKFDIDAEHTSAGGSPTYTYELTVKPNTAYTMSSNVPQGELASLYFNGGATNVNGVWSGTPRTFTSDENGKFTVFVRYNTTQGGIDLYTAVKNGQYYIQLEEGSTATSYAPYSNICPISGWTEANVYDDPVYGGTVAWNQLVRNGDFATTARWDYTSGTFSVANNIGTFTAQSQGQQVTQVIPYILNHKYLGIMQIKTTTATESIWLRFYGQNKVHTMATTNWQTVATIVNSIVDSSNSFGVRDDRTSSWDAIQIKNANLFDLTQAFGSIIADYIYSLEQATAGSGIAYFKSLFYKDYYPYNSGEKTCVSAVNGDTYIHTTIPFLDSQGNPITVYGGELDVVNGTSGNEKTLASVDMGDMNWTYSDSGGYFTGTINDCIIPTIYSNHKPICEVYNGRNPNYINVLNNGEIMYNTTFGAVFVKDSNYTDATLFKNSVAGKKIVYELATPSTFTSQPTSIKSLLGSNNVWGDTGEILEGEYIADASAVIAGLDARITALENA